jgi:hypothetical protein
MIKFLTLNRSLFIVAFLLLAVLGITTLWGGSTVPVAASDAMLQEGDLAYVESSSTFSVSTGSVSGSTVSFGLDGAYASESTVADTMESANMVATSAGCVAEGISEGAANASVMSVNTSGYSLPLQSDTYLPVTVDGVYSGTDVYADTSFSGTVLAHAGFSTTNPDFEMSDTSTSVGVSYADYSGGGGGGTDCCYDSDGRRLQDGVSMLAPFGNSSFMPATFMPASLLFTAGNDKVKEKNYRLNFRKQNGIPSFTSARVKKWKSNVPGTEDLANVSLVIDSTSFQYDAASGTINLKQKFHLKKASK